MVLFEGPPDRLRCNASDNILQTTYDRVPYSVDVVFHIGYHKTASSWLQQAYFPAHPEVRLICNARAPHNDSFLNYLVTTPDSKFDSAKCAALLQEKFEGLTSSSDKYLYLISAERLSGYPMSGGFDNFRIAERIQSVAPQSKILVVVREQTEMISSVYKQMIREGYPGTFEAMLDSRTWKTPGFDLSYFEYDLLINKYISLFGDKNVLALPFQLMVRDKNDFVKKLCMFLGISWINPPAEEKMVNGSLPTGGLNMIRRLNHLRSSELNPYPVFNLPDSLFIFLKKMIVRVSRKHRFGSNYMSGAQRQRLAKYYKESNDRLRNLTSISLSEDQ